MNYLTYTIFHYIIATSKCNHHREGAKMAYDFTGTNESGKQSYEGKIVKANAILDNAIEEMRNLGLADFLLSELLRERINPTAAWTAQDDPNFGA